MNHKPKPLVWLGLLTVLCLLFLPGRAMSQSDGTHQLRIRLRAGDGTAVTGETVILERLPDEEPIAPDCVTNASGECTWLVGRGLYQVLFARPLDRISALAVAEGGLRGFGVTVGDSPITYHFTFHGDGRVYFDAAPEAAVPSPVIPEGEMLHGGVEALATSSPKPTKGVAVMTTPSPQQAIREEAADTLTSDSNWRLLLFIGGGLCVGAGLHLWSRKRNKPVSEATGRSGKETIDA